MYTYCVRKGSFLTEKFIFIVIFSATAFCVWFGGKLQHCTKRKPICLKREWNKAFRALAFFLFAKSGITNMKVKLTFWCFVIESSVFQCVILRFSCSYPPFFIVTSPYGAYGARGSLFTNALFTIHYPIRKMRYFHVANIYLLLDLWIMQLDFSFLSIILSPWKGFSPKL